MKVVITAGGVKEKIDEVRSITNSSSGKLGKKIALNFLNIKDIEVIYIYAGIAESIEDSRVRNIYVKDTENLLSIVTEILTNEKIDIFIHSMAVADYTTSYVIDFGKLRNIVQNVEVKNLDNYIEECRVLSNSKISSNIEEPAVVLRKTPKVIKKIKEISPYTFLVGFKLLENVSEEELFDVGFDLLRKNRCNLVLANDIKKIREGNHRGLLIYPEKTFDIIEGKDNIAEYIYKKSMERYNVGHPKSIQVSSDNKISEDVFHKFYGMGLFLNQNDFLPKVINHDRVDKVGTYGNMSARVDGGFYMTCRNVDKSKLNKSDLSFIENVDMVSEGSVYSKVFYNSEIKPSIDTTIHSEIYNNTDWNNIVHIHTNKVFLGVPIVEKGYPCGCSEECKAILDIVKKNNQVEVIQMKKHGLIIMGKSFDSCAAKIIDLFANYPYIDYDSNKISDECFNHIIEVNPIFLTKEKVFPLCKGGEDIGFIYENINEDTNSVDFGIYTMENIRGKRLHIVEKYLNLYNKKYILHTTKDCKIADFYKEKYGFVDFDITDSQNLQYIRFDRR
jgi:phosphopantothenate-cysteine ligase